MRVPDTKVLLVGLMGTGKTSVGEEVARATGWPSLDNDVLLERSTGSTAAQLLAAHGLERLRAAESDVLTLLLSMPAPYVSGVAAGTVLDPHDRQRMRTGAHVVWLRTPVPTILKRVRRQPGRPFLDGEATEVLRVMAEEREPLYAQLAHQVVDTGTLTPRQAAQAVLAELG